MSPFNLEDRQQPNVSMRPLLLATCVSFFFLERVRVALYSKCGACYFKHLFFDVWCKIIGPDY